MRSTKSLVLGGLFLLLAAPRTARAQCPIESFGYSSGAVELDRAIVSQSGGPCVAHFLRKGPDGWRTTQTLEIGDFSIFMIPTAAIDGSRAIAGCPEATGSDELSGRAFVFELVGDRWLPTELVSPSNRSGDFFGTSVAIGGDVAVVGASHAGPDGIGDYLPRAHVFEFDGTSWRETAQITNYGAAIDVDGRRIVLGDPGTDPGRVYVYERIAGVWSWTAQVISYGSPNRPFLGTSVALDGDRLVVGAAPYSGGPGSVVVFRWMSGGWQQVQEIVPQAREPHDGFGASLALSGSTLLVGAPGALNWNGKVFRFEDDGTQFVERDSFDRGIREYDRFGTAVSLDGEDAFLGGEQGMGYLYRLGFEHADAYCPTTPNSTGAHGTLAVEGCDSFSASSFTLVASRLPPDVLALCFYGASAAQVPYGDGFRCVGPRIHRLPGGETDTAGNFTCSLDFGAASTTPVEAGSTWYFQALHRDRVGSGLNLTNALSIGITP
jgi:hypothetical protein